LAVLSLYNIRVEAMDEALQVLRTAEERLRALITRCVGEQRYGEVVAIARLADGLTVLSGHKREPFGTRAHSSSAPGRKSGKHAFPRFLRDDDKLIKIGWSKKSKSEYEHRAPYRVVETLVSAIQKKVRDGELFAATDVIPLVTSGEPIPDYQAYLALKWLHSQGTVSKHGRDRYSIEPGKPIRTRLEKLWDELEPYQPRNGS
jgi:hypothetical protein